MFFAWHLSRLYALSYTGQLDFLDQTVFWINRLAESLQPALFLHFALSFPEERFKDVRRRWLLPVIYAPGVVLLGLWIWAINFWQATELLKHSLDQLGTAYVAVFYILAALLFLRSYARADSPLLRQQLKWVTRGTLLAVLPFTLFSAVPFLLDLNPPRLLTNVAGLSLVFRPDLQLGDCALPADGHRPDLQAWHGVYVGHGPDPGRLFWGYRADCGDCAQRLPETVREWALVIAIVDHCGGFRSPQAQDSGLGGSRLRPASLRLSKGPCRVRAWIEFGDGFEGAAGIDCGAVAAHAAGGAGCGVHGRSRMAPVSAGRVSTGFPTE